MLSIPIPWTHKTHNPEPRICYIPPMPKFDPYKPPLSVEESERLLRREDGQDGARH